MRKAKFWQNPARLRPVPPWPTVLSALPSQSVTEDLPAIALVEDDPTIGENLCRALNDTYNVRWHRTGSEALADAPNTDLVILDLGLPDLDGVEVCRRIHASLPKLPIIILTARHAEMDVVAGLEAGAVDYVTKPFGLAELRARIGAHLRAVTVEPTTIVVGDLEIDTSARRVSVHGHERQLRAKEFDLLVELAENVGAVVTRDQLMRRVWDENWAGSTKTIDVHMASLRRKLTDDDVPACSISTLRGIGFRLERA